MTKGTTLSKKLSEIEERKKHYLARRVESSDRERVEEVSSGSRGSGGGGAGECVNAEPGPTSEGTKHVTFSLPQSDHSQTKRRNR